MTITTVTSRIVPLAHIDFRAYSQALDANDIDATVTLSTTTFGKDETLYVTSIFPQSHTVYTFKTLLEAQNQFAECVADIAKRLAELCF